MTDISKNGKINVWKTMAEADLGSWVSPKASRIQKFFEDILINGDFGNGTYATNEIDEDIAPYLRGFQFNSGEYKRFSITTCLDLHCCTIHGDDVVEDLMHYMMMQCKPYEESRQFWFVYYQTLQAEKLKSAKKTKKRTH